MLLYFCVAINSSTVKWGRSQLSHKGIEKKDLTDVCEALR